MSEILAQNNPISECEGCPHLEKRVSETSNPLELNNLLEIKELCQDYRNKPDKLCIILAMIRQSEEIKI